MKNQLQWLTRPILYPLLFTFLILGCTTAPTGNGDHEGTLLYETDFSAADEIIGLNPELELSGGTLKFLGEEPHCPFNLSYGQDSITELRLLRYTPETNAEIHLMHDHDAGSYIYYHFGEEETYMQMSLGGEKLLERRAAFPVRHGEWHSIRMELKKGESILLIDGEMVITAPIDKRMSRFGNLMPAAYQSQMEIDDLRIISLGQKGPEPLELPPIDGEIIYQTSFDRDEGRFEYHRGMKIHDGILDFVEDSPGCNYVDAYGQDSVTQFRLRLPSPQDSAHISLLWAPDDGMRMNYIIENGNISLGITVSDEHVYHDEAQTPVMPGKWHSVRIELRQGVTRLWLDGRRYIEAPIPEGLPERAWFFPLAHESQMQMDDLIIAELPRNEAVAAAEIKASAEPQRLKPLGQSDFGSRRIAVVGIKTEQAQLSAALASFVTNALVNMNIGRIVERSDVEQIISEYNFQASAITDESTAVEIGKLLGADIIAVGSLYQVGTIDYLNIKLIEVETGEIVASSMSSSTVEEEYLRMCNEAVEQIGR